MICWIATKCGRSWFRGSTKPSRYSSNPDELIEYEKRGQVLNCQLSNKSYISRIDPIFLQILQKKVRALWEEPEDEKPTKRAL